VRVLDRVRGRELHVLVVEREEEEHRAGRRQHEVEERVELGAPLRPVVPDAAEADEDVDDHDDDHRERRDEREPDERPPLPAEGEREDERDDAHPDDRHVWRLEPRVRPAEPTTANGTVRRGLRASSPSGAAASKPMKARIANTMPRKTPLQPPRAWCGLNGARLRSPVFESSIQTASAPKTAISNAPRITPAVVDSRTSR